MNFNVKRIEGESRWRIDRYGREGYGDCSMPLVGKYWSSYDIHARGSYGKLMRLMLRIQKQSGRLRSYRIKENN